MPRSFSLPLLDKIILERSFPRDNFRTLAILCINCEEFIECEAIDRHSSVCVRISKAIADREESGELEINELRFERLQEFVNGLVKKAKTPSQRSILSVISKVCKEAAGVKALNKLDELQRVQVSIKASALHLESSIAIQLCSDRLVALIEQRKSAIEDLDRQASQEKLGLLKSEVSFYRERAEQLEIRLNRSNSGLDKVDSEILSNQSADLSEFTVLSSEPTEFKDMSYQDLDSRAEMSHTATSLKRLFYSYCLSVKLGIPQGHPAHKIPILKLYKAVMRENLPIDKWKSFIMSNFERVLDESQHRASSSLIRTITESDELEGSFTR